MLALALPYFALCANSSSNSPLPIGAHCPNITDKYYLRKNIYARANEWNSNLLNYSQTSRPINLIRLIKFYDKLMTNSSSVEIAVLGGSLTMGRNAGNIPGSWPIQLGDMLNNFQQEGRSKSNTKSYINKVNVKNNAVGGTDLVWALYALDSLVDDNTDLLIIDYDVNDCIHIQGNTRTVDFVMSVTELAVRRLMQRKNPPAIIFLNVAHQHRTVEKFTKPDCKTFYSCYSIGEMRLPILDAYYVPTISQKLALWHDFACPPPFALWSCTNRCHHPPRLSHTLLAEMVQYFILKEIPKYLKIPVFIAGGKSSIADMPVNPLHPDTIALEKQICPFHLTTVSHPSSKYFLPPTGPGGNTLPAPCWNYTADVPGKYGWIGIECYNDSLEFVLSFGASPKLALTFLHTYAPNTGLVMLSLRELDSNQTNLVGYLDLITGVADTFSISKVFTFHHYNGYSNIRGVPAHYMPVNSTRVLRVTQVNANVEPGRAFRLQRRRFDRANPQKVKLISVASC